MTIVIKNRLSQIKKNHDNMERIARYHGLAIVDGQIKPFLDLRLYMSRSASASTVTCDLWVFGNFNGESLHVSANGKAGGYGYCKQSAASHAAFAQIFDGFESVSGRGMDAVRNLITQIGTDVFGLQGVVVIS